MANRFEPDEIERRLDRDWEREGGYRGERRIPLSPRGALREYFEKKTGGAR